MRILKSNWIKEYLRYTQKQESPTVFHLWVAFSTIASTLGRNVWVDYGYLNLYPNLYIILVADSAWCRKSTAIRIGTDLILAIDNAPTFLSQKITPEAMIRELEMAGMLNKEDGERKNCECVIISEELAVFLGSDCFSDGTAALMTNLFDCPDLWTYETKGGGKEKLHDVAVNFIGASTPNWLMRSIPRDASGGGFVGRFLRVYAEGGEKLISVPRLDEEDMQKKSDLINDLNDIRSMKGEFVLSQDAYTYFDVWYRDWMSTDRRFDETGYSAKKHTFILKLAMILSAARSSELVIEQQDIENAVKNLDKIEPEMDILSEQLDATAKGKEVESIYRRICKAGIIGMNRTDLMRSCWRLVDADGMDRAIGTLMGAGLIKQYSMKGEKRPTIMYMVNRPEKSKKFPF